MSTPPSAAGSDRFCPKCCNPTPSLAQFCLQCGNELDINSEGHRTTAQQTGATATSAWSNKLPLIAVAGALFLTVVAATFFTILHPFDKRPTTIAGPIVDVHRTPSSSIPMLPSQMPPALKRLLDNKYPGWTFPIVSDEDRHICKPPNPAFLPGFVWADFDGDNQRDYAVQIAYRGSRYTLVFLSRGSGFDEYVLEQTTPDTKGWELLGVVPKGEKLPNLDQGGQTFLTQDALLGIRCESSAAAYVYSNGRFQHFFISD